MEITTQTPKPLRAGQRVLLANPLGDWLTPGVVEKAPEGFRTEKHRKWVRLETGGLVCVHPGWLIRDEGIE